MKKVRFLLIVAFILGVCTVVVPAQAESYSSTLNMFRNSPQVRDFFDNSYGYAVFPTIGKAGYVIGGSYGNGRVYRGGRVTGRSMVIEGSIGFQIGGEAFSEIIFFEDKRAYQEFTSGNFEFRQGAFTYVAGWQLSVARVKRQNTNKKSCGGQWLG